MKNKKLLIIFILVPLILGAIIGLITSPGSNIDSIIPSWVFPIVWTILYILMGISSYLIYEETGKILPIYIIQLVLNLLWPIAFFSLKLYTLSYLWILALIFLVILMIFKFLNISKLAGYLQIPYVIWLVIASVLNLLIIIS